MKISDYFHLEEFLASETAGRRGIDNTPPPEILEVLKETAHKLDAVRVYLGHPIMISSGYRSPALNKAVGGSPTSAHMHGLAADFICPGFGSPLMIVQRIAASGFSWDQVIEEGTWVHLSFDPRGRRQVLTKTKTGYVTGVAR